MSIDFWIRAGHITFGLIILALTLLMSRKTKTELSHGTLFKLGTIFLAAGIGGEILSASYGGFGLDAFLVLGAAYIAVGLSAKRNARQK